MQMRRGDPRVSELFGYLRKAIDVLEQIMLRPATSPEANPASQIGSEDRPSSVVSEPAIPKKRAREGRVRLALSQKKAKTEEWRPRQDSNLRPLV
jgi:hypothetical protein